MMWYFLANFIYIFACLHVTNNDIFYMKVTKKKQKQKNFNYLLFLSMHIFIKFHSNWTGVTVLFFYNMWQSYVIMLVVCVSVHVFVCLPVRPSIHLSYIRIFVS